MKKFHSLFPLLIFGVLILGLFLIPTGKVGAITEKEIIINEKESKDSKKNKIIIQPVSNGLINANHITEDVVEIERLNSLEIETIEIVGDEVEDTVRKLIENEDIESVEKNKIRRLSSVQYNDPYIRYQKSLELLKIPAVWEMVGTGERQIVVGVLDSGINKNHKDLKGQFIGGYNFLNNSTDVYDINGHGTAVSAIIAARTNNEIGITGITGLVDIKVMPLQVAYEDGSIYTSDVISAINYAIESNVDILNLSFSGSDYSNAENAAIQKAIKAGIVIVAASGNDGKLVNQYPASYSGVISVGSVNYSKVRSDFSNYGSKLDITAPGENILTANTDGGYGYWTGTSFSSPHVAGIAALMKFVNPSIQVSDIESILFTTSLDLGTSGKDSHYGYGLIQADQAVAAVVNETLLMPNVQVVSDQDTFIKGRSINKGSKVVAEVNQTIIGESTVLNDDTFSIPISKLKAGVKVDVYILKNSGEKSMSKSFTVLDKTSPYQPKVRPISNISPSVSGFAEANSRIEIYKEKTLLAKGTVDSGGKFKISIPRQKEFSTLTFYVFDQSNNKSSGYSTEVLDKRAPVQPTIRKVTNKSTYINGKGEPGAKFYVQVNNKFIASGNVTSKGNISVKIRKLNARTKLKIYLKDKSGNVSEVRVISVSDAIAPSPPSVNNISQRNTLVYGQAEANAIIEVKVGKKVIAKGQASSTGKYRVKINKQPRGTHLLIYAIDKSGNRSKAKEILVK